MPRSGILGTYSLPGAQATQVPGTPIPSAVNNQGYSDIEQTFNTPQPIAYGGTGATTAVGGADALSPAFVNVASSATTNIGAAASPNVTITGNTGITAFDSVAAGIRRHGYFSGTPTLTHNAVSLILPGNANINAAVGDSFEAVSLGSGNWKVTDYNKISGAPIVGGGLTGRNRIVNGSMRDSQENGNGLGTSNGYSPADQWFLYFTTTGAGRSIQRIQQRTLAGALDQLEYKCTTAKAVLGANDSETISQPLEGSNVSDCAFGTAAAKPFVDRFQVQLPAGTYHMHYANSAGNRHCAVPFVIAGGEANTPVVKSVVIPADTGGTWLTADGVIGIIRDLVLAAGSNLTGGTASTWGATPYYAATTQANILSSTSNIARLSDVGLRLDPEATGVYGQYEVAEVDVVYRGDRYVEISAAISPLGTIISHAFDDVSANQYAMWRFKTRKAKNPTFALLTGGWNGTPSDFGYSVDAVAFYRNIGRFSTTGTLIAYSRLS